MAELGFDGQVAIVTGAANGLGRAQALLLAARGAQVAESRGNRYRHAKPEAMSSDSGTHRLLR
jgi:NAD(P)-dependent dehydrogenase (short-subunit alcohol dehydrogenase family)